MTSPITFASALVLGLSVAGTASATCMNFYQHFGGGPFSGGSVQIDPNTILHMSPEKFWGPPATPTSRFGSAEMVQMKRCFGGPGLLSLNNANLAIKIEQNNPDAKRVNVNFCDFGGYENAALNFNTPPDFIGEISAQLPPQLPNAAGQPEGVSLATNPIPGGYEAKLEIQAQSDYIREIVIGGQEFFVHSICVN